MAGDERRQQIIRVAMKLFSEHGFSGTTTRQIAVASGVSEATVFKYFANKEELYADILDHKACSHDFQDPLSLVGEYMEKGDDYQVFYNMALNALRNHEEDTAFMRLLMHAALEGHELTRMFFESFVSSIYERIGNYIRRRQKEGAFRDVDPKVVVRSFIGMFVHHSLNNILWDKEQKLLKISNEKAAESFATILLDGIRKKD